jgi:hypothetical protein
MHIDETPSQEESDMKLNRAWSSTLLLFISLNLMAQSAGQKSFDVMKSLAGNWEGKNSMGDPVQVSFRLTANGTVIMSEIQSQMNDGKEDMVSMIHLDGKRLLLTHYCPNGNQPRMQANASTDGKIITFEFLDATNLASPEDGHIHRVAFTLVDDKHHIEEWHYLEHGKEVVARFDLQKKS